MKSSIRILTLTFFALTVLNTNAPYAEASPKRWGVLDANAQVVVKPIYKNAEAAQEALHQASGCPGNHGSRKLQPGDDPFITRRKNGSIRFVPINDVDRGNSLTRVTGKDEKILAETPWHRAEYLNPGRWILSSDGGAVTVIDDTGKHVKEFEPGTRVWLVLNNNRFIVISENHTRLCDDEGTVVADLSTFSELEELDGHTIIGKCKSGYALIDFNGKVIAPLKGVEEIDRQKCPEKLFLAKFTNGNSGYVDYQGKVVIAPRFTFAKPFANGYAKIGFRDKARRMHLGFVDKTGKIVFDKQCSVIYGDAADKLILHDNNGFALVDFASSKEIARLPKNCVDVAPFSEGLSAITLEPSGVAPKFEQPSERATISFINEAGKIVIPARPAWVFNSHPKFSSGLTPIKTGDNHFSLQGYMDKTGQIKIQPQYFEAGEFVNGRALFCVRDQRFDKKEFDRPLQNADDWRADEAQFFLHQQNVVGMTKNEIRSMLGSPDWSDATTDSYLIIPGICSMSSQTLQFKYAKDKVDQYRLAQGMALVGEWQKAPSKSKYFEWVQAHAAK